MVTGDCNTALPAGSSELTLAVDVFDLVLVPVAVSVPVPVPVPVPEAVSDVDVLPAVFKSVAEAASVVVFVASVADAVCVAVAEAAASIVSC